MRHTPSYILDDDVELRRLVGENPWCTIVSSTHERGIIASHYPFLLDEEAERLTLLSHVGRPDDALHELGDHEVLVIVQGPHGYVSPSWYEPGDIVPTWNHVTAHLYGTPQIVSDEENLLTLGRLTDHFERHVPEPRGLHLDQEYSRRVARGTVGLKLEVERVDARVKLSQNKPEHVVRRIIAELEGHGAYAQQELAREMRRVHDPRDS